MVPASKELINKSNKDSFPSININEKVSNSLEMNSNSINNDIKPLIYRVIQIKK